MLATNMLPVQYAPHAASSDTGYTHVLLWIEASYMEYRLPYDTLAMLLGPLGTGCTYSLLWDKLLKSRGCSLEKLSLGSSQGRSPRELPGDSFSRLPKAFQQFVRLC